MATISPFRGIRFNEAVVKDLADVITPPYDVVNETKQKELYALSAYNHIRLEYGVEKSDDNFAENRYTRAADTFNRWLKDSVLIRDETPAMYWYEQCFSWEGQNYSREGLITTLKVEPYRSKTVLPHEETLAKPKEDRLQLMRHCQANFSPIFALYPDRHNDVDNVCCPLKQNLPLVEFTDREGQTHRVWIIEDTRMQQQLIDLFQPWQIILADGHHRYETAIAFAEEQAASGKEGFDRLMVVLVNLHSPGLLILPTHRVIHDIPSFNSAALLTKLQESFIVSDEGEASEESLKLFLDELNQKGLHSCALGLCTDEHFYHLLWKGSAGQPERMDADVLREYVLDKILGQSADDLKKGEILTYTRNENEAWQMVIAKKAQASFFLNPPLMNHVLNSVRSGQRLPQKSTYFYPKLISGLLINKIGD